MIANKIMTNDDIFHLAVERHDDFWHGKEDQLRILIEKISKEILSLENAAHKKNILSMKEACKIKAIWVLSGVGTYKKPITDASGDLTYKNKTWAQNTDRIRIDYGAKIFAQIKQFSGKEPFFIYNGIKIQDKDLQETIQADRITVSEERLFIPKGEIRRTLDQVQNLELPKINFDAGDKIGIVSHAPHLSRVMRMVNTYKPFPPELKVKLFPIIFPDTVNEANFAANEMIGIIDYLSRGEASAEPYPFEI